MAETAMLTARIPADVKERAAENLKQMGYSTSQTIQFVWQYLADSPVSEGKKFLEPAVNKEDEELARRRAAFERSKELIMTPERFEKMFGVKMSEDRTFLTKEEVRELRYKERMARVYGEEF